ncbi:MAG: glutamine synthetase family protein [Xanthobacteraceae bacterium]
MTDTRGFIERHGLWTDEQRRQADEIKRRIELDKLQLIRVCWADPHGAVRAKALTAPAFVAALETGYNINVATTTLDSANARTFASFTRGGGMGLAEMTGSPNLTIVPDPATFRVLPWGERIGWVLCDEYFASGVPFHFSPRQLLRRQLKRLAAMKMNLLVGLEIEWYLLRVAAEQLSLENTGAPGVRPRPIATLPVEPGFSYHSETHLDLMQPVISALATGYEQMGLPLRSMENEWGPGQLECTFAAQGALEAADNAVLFRSATRQMCRRMGYLASFMCRPPLGSFCSSGWHLHQSLVDVASGRNVFIPESEGEWLSPLGRSFLGGLLQHGVPAAAFATPTVNGYRRYRPNSLAPDRVTWCHDHRGVMLRVLGGAGDPATRIENRIGEPAANPYLYMVSQIVAGLDGLEHRLDPGPPDEEPYEAKRPMLPTSLPEALDALDRSPLFRTQLGDVFIDYFLAVKRNEASRFAAWCTENGVREDGTPTQWEQNEYFDFF